MISLHFFFCCIGVELQLRMAGDSRVLMDHNMEIGVTSAQVNCTATTGQTHLYCLSTTGKESITLCMIELI